jgi:hypothetical protein
MGDRTEYTGQHKETYSEWWGSGIKIHNYSNRSVWYHLNSTVIKIHFTWNKQEYRWQILRLQQLTLRKAGKLQHWTLSVQQCCVLPSSHVLVIRRTAIAFTRWYTAYLTAICMYYVGLYARWRTVASVSGCVLLWTQRVATVSIHWMSQL